jgi:predicted ATPase
MQLAKLEELVRHWERITTGARRIGDIKHSSRDLGPSRITHLSLVQLRAATSLCRLLGQRDRRDEARHLLGDVYARFTEGFDAANLADARALLAELS